VIEIGAFTSPQSFDTVRWMTDSHDGCEEPAPVSLVLRGVGRPF